MTISADTANRMAIALALASAGAEVITALDAARVALSGDVTSDASNVTTIGPLKVTQAMQALASHDGTIVAVNAADAVIGSIPVLHRIAIAAGALAAKNVVLTHKTRVVDAFVVLEGGGVVNTTCTIGNGANAITNALDVSGADKALIRAATIDDAQQDIAAGGSLRVTMAVGATQPACTVYVWGVRVA